MAKKKNKVVKKTKRTKKAKVYSPKVIKEAYKEWENVNNYSYIHNNVLYTGKIREALELLDMILAHTDLQIDGCDKKELKYSFIGTVSKKDFNRILNYLNPEEAKNTIGIASGTEERKLKRKK